MKSLCIYLLIPLFGMAHAAFGSETTEYYTAHFEHDADKLSKTELLKLKAHFDELSISDAYEVTITGHTDDNGSDAYNQQLSERRSKFIFYSLLYFGLDEGLVSIDWKGESAPAELSTSNAGRAKNRRVEIELKRYTFNSTSDLQNALSSNTTQTFTLDAQSNQLIVGNEGVQVSVPANSFVNANGEIETGSVTLNLKEALTFGSFHDYNLSTTSGSQLLETGGMVYLEATNENGEPLSLRKGATVSMMLPTQQKQERMELFTSQDGSNWQQVGQQPARPSWSSSSLSYVEYGGPVRPMWNFHPPRFAFDQEAPQKPSKPRMPRKPHKPRKENYEVAPTFVNKLFWKSKNQQAEEKYQRHLTTYERKQKQYVKKLEDYHTQFEKYEAKLESFDCDVEQYHQNRWEAYKNFKKTDKYQKALKRYERHFNAQLEKFQEDYEQWQCYREYRMIEMGEKADKTGFTNQQAMNNYVYTLNKMGWINCDRFLNNPPNMLTNLKVADQDTSEEVVYLVFKDVRSMIGLRAVESDYTMYNYPLNERAELFAYKVVEGKPMVCHKEVTGKKHDELVFKPSSFKEIKSILESFDEKQIAS